jgi:8-oxo-dGTP pyrophosphatase MutT (NUDIX family)
MDPDILGDQTGFRKQVMDALSREPLDYVEQFAFIERQRDKKESFAGGAVLLPLFFQQEKKSGEQRPGEYVFLLNKRSKKVLQPGDLCAPGGGIHPFFDSLTQKILRFKLLPGVGGPGLEPARKRGKGAYEKILFLLGNALRESWEELRLSPFNVEFLGPLPTYPLSSRRWIILPPFTFRQVGRRWIEFQAFPGPEARALRAKTMRHPSFSGSGGQALLRARRGVIPM